MENFEISRHIEDFTERLTDLKDVLQIDNLQKKIASLEEEMMAPAFWDNPDHAQKVLKLLKQDKDILEKYLTIAKLLDDLEVYFAMHKAGEEGLLLEIENLILEIEKFLSNFEIEMLLNHEYDDASAYIELHPGAGGTESQDWTSMLFRMYRRYAEKKGYEFEIIDYQEGEEAGIKSVSFIIHGPKAYGYLRSEHGVHRLIRISPFDSNARRHTSFCACHVTPDIEEEINIEIKPDDIRVDTFRSSGAGGQHVNKTDSAVRITHLPTGIVVTCQSERSQIQNRERAMKILKAKLVQREYEAQQRRLKEISGDIDEISFGSQIRSYIFHPYSLVKDHRTNYETSDIMSVMDGEIDDFINAYLKSKYNKR